MKRLFLAHHHRDAVEARGQAHALRLHGVVPWIDKDGGFSIGDEAESEARRAIREECFGLLVYATDQVFRSRFVRDVEIDEARRVKGQHPHFMLAAVPRNLTFEELSGLSKVAFGMNLTDFHTTAPVFCEKQDDFLRAMDDVARQVLSALLRSHTVNDGTFHLQVSTRDRMPIRRNDVLCVDCTTCLRDDPLNTQMWQRLLESLRQIKQLLAETHGRPRLAVHGSKHLTAAFLFGRIFAPHDMDIQQSTKEVWHTDIPPSEASPLQATVSGQKNIGGHLFVEIATGHKNVALYRRTPKATFGLEGTHLRLQPAAKPCELDNRVCVAIALQARVEIERAIAQFQPKEVHFFVAAPQFLMIMLGRILTALPTTQVYEWKNEQYHRSITLPSGVL